MKQTKKLNILAKVKSFPSMPGAAEKLLKLFDNPDTTAAQIEQILRYDQGLTANLLKLTNSAYFGLPCKVGSVKQAVVLLGWKRLVQLVMASCVNAVMGKPVPGYDLPAGELWRHSIAVSVAAEGLAKELKISASEEIFTAALLHDVGKLVLGDFVKEDLEKIETEASRGISFEVAERIVLGTDHAEIGAQILKNWSFPPALVNAVRWHHDPDSAGKTDILVDIVHVANILYLMIGIGVGREGLCYKPSPLATKRLGLRTNDLEMVASRTLQYVDDLCDVFES
ncbi:MAG: HDOD domain-containing protein [Desulfobacterales bacterium]|nr:HDOD domain-containing protein [Desulfobacterales bacterium]